MYGNHFPEMMVLLVTGGIGSGKSVVCRMLEESGIPVYDSDSRAKSLYDNDPVLLGEVKSLFGDDIVGGKAYMDLKTVDAANAAYAEALAEGSNVELDGTILIYTMTDSDVQAFDGVPKDQLVMLMTLAGGNLGGGISDIMDNLGNLGNSGGIGGLGDLGNLFGGK